MDDFNNNNNENNVNNSGNDGGVNLFKAPEPAESAKQGESNVQQGMNFSGQQNFGGQPDPNQIQPGQFQQNQFGGQNMNGYNPNQNMNQGGDTVLAIISLICGIVSVITCCCTPISILTGLAGVILGVISKSKNMGGAGMALAGIITGGVGFLGTIMFRIVGSGFMEGFSEEFSKAMREAAESVCHFMFM